MIYKNKSRHEHKVLVTFEIPGSVWAERIHFRHTRDEKWRIEVELDRGREYRFRYLIDGDNWGNDWHADRHVPGTDGSSDSVIVAELSPQTWE
jgi:hypothetical protein